MNKKYYRWAIAFNHEFLLGKHFWPDAAEDEIPTRTFRTRELARAAMKEIKVRCPNNKYTKDLRIVKVCVSIEEVK